VTESSPSIGIIDIGCGNLKSIEAACAHVGINARVFQCPDQCAGLDGLILPGVGAFGFFMDRLRQTSFDVAINEYVASGGMLLGICLGMQILFDSSDESEGVIGLSFLSGKVKKLPAIGVDDRVPHVGWSKITPANPSGIAFGDLNVAKQYFYFVHSYYVQPNDASVCSSYAQVNDMQFCASIETRQLLATQFHPEKSGPNALKIFSYFESKIRENL
jgi:glutamine amidotransferase